MSLSDIVSITITKSTAGVAQVGFGTPLILSAKATFTERVRSYSQPSDLVADGFVATDAEYMLAVALMSQNPRPSKFLIGRCANKPTQSFTIGVKSVVNNTTYAFSFLDPAGVRHAVTYTSDGSAANDTIIAGLVASLGAITGLTITTTGSSTAHKMNIVASAAGATFCAVKVLASMTDLLTVVQDHADPGVAADITAIRNQDDTWYVLLNPWGSLLTTLAIATALEGTNKLHLASSGDSEIVAVSLGGGANDVAKQLQAAKRIRTPIFYGEDPSEFIAAAVAGVCLPLDPGSETWKFKTPSGPTPSVLTTTQLANAVAKACNTYTSVAGRAITAEGVSPSGDFIDTTRFTDWLQARMAERIFGALANAPKVPFTDAGIAVVENEIRGQLNDGIKAGGLSSDPKPTVTVPLAASISPSDKAARRLTGVTFTAELAGAIHSTTLVGTITV